MKNEANFRNFLFEFCLINVKFEMENLVNEFE